MQHQPVLFNDLKIPHHLHSLLSSTIAEEYLQQAQKAAVAAEEEVREELCSHILGAAPKDSKVEQLLNHKHWTLKPDGEKETSKQTILQTLVERSVDFKKKRIFPVAYEVLIEGLLCEEFPSLQDILDAAAKFNDIAAMPWKLICEPIPVPKEDPHPGARILEDSPKWVPRETVRFLFCEKIVV